MVEVIGLTLLGLLFLALGGDSLVKGAAGLGAQLRVPPFALGLCLVAVATSLPELAVNARAVATGDRALALGNAVGSNIVNIGLTLGAAALAAPLVLRWRALRPLLAVLLLATVGVILASLDGGLSRAEGGVLLLAFLAVVAFATARASDESPEVRTEVEDFTRTRGGGVQNLLRVAVGAVLLWFGAAWVVAQVPVIGHALGMDSLVAVELSNRLKPLVGRPLGATLAFDQPTVAQLSAHLDRVVQGGDETERSDGRFDGDQAPGSGVLLARLPELSESEVDAELERLERLEREESGRASD